MQDRLDFFLCFLLEVLEPCTSHWCPWPILRSFGVMCNYVSIQLFPWGHTTVPASCVIKCLFARLCHFLRSVDCITVRLWGALSSQGSRCLFFHQMSCHAVFILHLSSKTWNWVIFLFQQFSFFRYWLFPLSFALPHKCEHRFINIDEVTAGVFCGPRLQHAAVPCRVGQ